MKPLQRCPRRCPYVKMHLLPTGHSAVHRERYVFSLDYLPQALAPPNLHLQPPSLPILGLGQKCLELPHDSSDVPTMIQPHNCEKMAFPQLTFKKYMATLRPTLISTIPAGSFPRAVGY